MMGDLSIDIIQEEARYEPCSRSRVCVCGGGGWGTLSIIVTNSTLVSFTLIVSTFPPSSGEQTT